MYIHTVLAGEAIAVVMAELEFASTVYRYVVRILLTAAVAAAVYVCLKGARRAFKAYQEIFVMWTIGFGRRWMPESKSLRIQPFFCKTAELDDVSVLECFRFHNEAFSTAEYIPEEKLLELYRKVLLSYSHILLCRERLDGSLRGLVLLGLERKPTYSLLKIGLMLTHHHYRGGPWMRLACACMIIRELVLHPLTPLYVLGKLSTYKSYLIASRFRECYPRYDRETPELMKTIAEEFVASIKLPSESFDRDTMVLRRRFGVVKDHVAPISERDLQNPHIKFFNDRNPGWREGDQLVTLSIMTWGNVLNNLVKVSLNQLRHSRKCGDTVPSGVSSAGNVDRKKAQLLKHQTKFLRGTSYQDSEASIHSVRFHMSEYGEDEEREVVSRQRCNKPPPFPVDRLYSQEENEEFNIEFNF